MQIQFNTMTVTRGGQYLSANPERVQHATKYNTYEAQQNRDSVAIFSEQNIQNALRL